jgi:DNA (cytosine-5)-methyltransferase 1
MTATAKVLRKKITTGDVLTDLFCGGGGTTTGAKRALERLGYKFSMVAINHWDLAIETHTHNHPDVTHYCQSIDTLLPQEIIPGLKLKLLLASPECTDHSNAKGGKPRSDQKRADAWLLQRWIEKLDIDTIVIENVKEFVKWGPLNKKGLPDKRRRGAFFRNFISFLEISYTVEWRILNAADYGDATSRERFILIAKKGKNRKIEFPEPTHASRKILSKSQPDFFSRNLKQWRSAAEIIDWNRKGQSIFGRKNGLSPNTMKRIHAGLRKFSGIDLPDREVYTIKSLFSFLPKNKRAKISMVYRDEFQAKLEKNKYLLVPIWECVVRDAKGKILGHYQHPSKEALEEERAAKQAPIDEVVRQTPIKIDWTKCKPFTIPTNVQNGTEDIAEHFAVNLKASDRRMRSTKEPTFTQTTANHQYLCETIVANFSHTQNNHDSMCKSDGDPLPTICGKGMLGMIQSLPFLVQSYGEREGQEPRTRDILEPTWTVTPQVRMNMVEPCLVKYYLGSDAVSVREPAPTITANYEHIALTTPFIVPCNHGAGDTRVHSIDDPMKTITNVDGFAFVEPFLVIFRKNQDPHGIDEPLKTLTTRDSYGLVEVQIADSENSPIPVNEVGLFIPSHGIILFVRFRMFHETELARAMGFPEGYHFAGTRQDRVTQIGNAVPCGLSEAVVYTAMKDVNKSPTKKAKKGN